MGNSRIIINTVEDTLVSSTSALPLEIGVVLKAPKGPVGTPIKVTTEAELIDKFGTPTTTYPVLDAVRSFLKLYGGITVSRLKFSVDGASSFVNAVSTDIVPVSLVKLEGKSFSNFEDDFELSLLSVSGSSLNFILRDKNAAVLESFTVPAYAPDFIAQVNYQSEYVVASLVPAHGSTTMLVGTTKPAETDTPLVFDNGAIGSNYVLQDVLNAIQAFESITIGRMDIVAAPGLADFSDASWGTAWVTLTDYEVGDIVIKDGAKYECLDIHESGVFADDLAAGNWAAVTEFGKVIDALIALTAERRETITLADFVANDTVANVVAKVTPIPMESKVIFYHPGVKMRLSSGNNQVVPASMAALFVHAAASVVNRWASPAGFTTTMSIPNVSDFFVTLKQSEADTLYNLTNAARPAINPIVYDNSVGWVIDGQRTAAESTNIRRSISIEKLLNEIVYETNVKSKRYQYKPNNETTWDSWKLDMNSYLSNILTQGGISSFQVFMGTNTMTSADIQAGRLIGLIKIVPTFTVEEITITINVNVEA